MLRGRLFGLGVICCCISVSLASCGNGNGGGVTPATGNGTRGVTPAAGCTEQYPERASGAGVLSACATSDGSGLSVVNISNSVLELTPTEQSGISSALYVEASASSVSAALLQEAVTAGCDGSRCTVRKGDAVVFSGVPPATVYVRVQPSDTVAGDVASILGSYLDKYLTTPSALVKQSAVACAQNLQDLTAPQPFPADAIRQTLSTYQPCKSTYQAIFGESKQADSVANDLVSSLEGKVKANFVDELLEGVARVHPR